MPLSKVGPWRPANIKDLPGEPAHVINQSVRETNARIDNLVALQRPHVKGVSNIVFGSIPGNSSVEVPVHLFGALPQGVAVASPADGLDIGSVHLAWSARITAPNTIAVKLTNPTTSPISANTIKWNLGVLL